MSDGHHWYDGHHGYGGHPMGGALHPTLLRGGMYEDDGAWSLSYHKSMYDDSDDSDADMSPRRTYTTQSSDKKPTRKPGSAKRKAAKKKPKSAKKKPTSATRKPIKKKPTSAKSKSGKKKPTSAKRKPTKKASPKGKRPLNAYMKKVIAARDSGAKSFVYNDATYVRNVKPNGLIVYKRA